MGEVSGLPPFFQPMLAAGASRAFDSADHLFEVKWDGVRTLAFCTKDSTRLYSRTGREVTHQYPEFGGLHTRMRTESAVFDSEIVAMDSAGRPSFELLQQRINLTRPADVARARQKFSLDMVLFDIPFADGGWLKLRPLVDRIDKLASAMQFEERVLRSEAVAGQGIALFDAAKLKGLEGIVAKKAISTYQPGKRTTDWLKIKVVQQADCVIGGWTAGAGARSGYLGALLMGVWDQGSLRYIGSVGTGFTEQTLDHLGRLLAANEAPASPFAGETGVKQARWVMPKLVCEVEYRELTSALKLRAPAFKRLRDDKPPQDCLLEDLLPKTP